VSELPLADASRRLRGRPGRPRKVMTEEEREARAEADRTRMRVIRAAARYLSVSVWSIRDLVAAGRLHPVRLPLGQRPNGEPRELRRLLVDVHDLDRLIDASKEAAETSR
jgi:hypothetical protein